MSSEEYWRRREEAQRRKNITDEREYAKEIRGIYANMMDNVRREIESFYARYAAKEGITMAEAKKRVSRLDIEAYERKAKRYVQAAAQDRKANGKTDKNAFYFSKQANEEMRLYNLTMKVNRLEMLKANIGLELVSGFDELQKFFDRKLTDRTLGEFRRQAGILGRSVQNNAKFAHAIVNASFHNATFSERIWKEQATLKSELDRLIQIGLIQGRNPRVLARDLQKRFGVSQSDAERLMTTELRRVQTEAQKQAYIRNGYEEYQFLALGSACPVCADLNEKHFKVMEMQLGVNAPPIHPRCRCSTSAYMDREEFERWLEEENQRMHERMNAEEEAAEGRANAGPSLIGAIASEVLTSAPASGKQQSQNSPDTVANGGKRGIIKVEFSSPELLKKHYSKHQSEFGGISEERYIELANELANADPSDDVEMLIRSDGSVSIYKFSTNEFLVITKEGNIRTYFKPQKGADYWREEHERNRKD